MKFLTYFSLLMVLHSHFLYAEVSIEQARSMIKTLSTVKGPDQPQIKPESKVTLLSAGSISSVASALFAPPEILDRSPIVKCPEILPRSLRADFLKGSISPDDVVLELERCWLNGRCGCTGSYFANSFKADTNSDFKAILGIYILGHYGVGATEKPVLEIAKFLTTSFGFTSDEVTSLMKVTPSSTDESFASGLSRWW